MKEWKKQVKTNRKKENNEEKRSKSLQRKINPSYFARQKENEKINLQMKIQQ